MIKFNGFRSLKRKKRRGVTRTIDFTVAFSLFIIIYVQFLLVIINVNFLINTVEEDGNPAKNLTERLLSKSGFNSDGSGTNWAYSTSIPDDLGFLSTESTYYKTLFDLNKLGRLNPDLDSFQTSSLIPYQRITLDSRSDLGLNEEFSNIRITTRAFYNVTVESTVNAGNISSVTVSVNSIKYNKPLSGIDVVFTVYNFTDQSFIGEGSSFTNNLGSVTFTTAIPEPNNPYIIFAYAESPILSNVDEGIPLWGVGWTASQSGGSIQPGQISSFITENNTHTNFSVIHSDSGINASSQTFFPTRDSSLSQNNLTFIPGNITSTPTETFLSTTYNSGTKPMFLFGFYDEGVNQYRYQVTSLPMLFQGKDSLGANSQILSYNEIETSSFSLWESEGKFRNLYSYEQIVFSRRGPFILKIEVASQ
ncbi:MAG: hypothetical protein ACW981_14370 [Candidatus Hodarchaeales archaeon]|jgi:hypothetical protein